MNTGQSMQWRSRASEATRHPAWWWVAVRGLGALATLAVSAFVFLLISEHRPLFGFMEPGYDPAAITAARVAEGATVALLGTFVIARYVAGVPMPRW